MPTAMTNRKNHLSREEEHFVEICCGILGIKFCDKVEQIEGDGGGGGEKRPLKTIKAIRCLLEKLGDEVEDHRRWAQSENTELRWLEINKCPWPLCHNLAATLSHIGRSHDPGGNGQPITSLEGGAACEQED